MMEDAVDSLGFGISVNNSICGVAWSRHIHSMNDSLCIVRGQGIHPVLHVPNPMHRFDVGDLVAR
jgi:hypothetical protein